MDMFDMNALGDASFDVVLDKGTMDAILVRRCNDGPTNIVLQQLIILRHPTNSIFRRFKSHLGN